VTTWGVVPARTLTPASARAFDPYGSGQGDNPQGAHLAIDGTPATAWHADWYTTAPGYRDARRPIQRDENALLCRRPGCAGRGRSSRSVHQVEHTIY
jgi:hypothetical protein